jgi:hypothetical protein
VRASLEGWLRGAGEVVSQEAHNNGDAWTVRSRAMPQEPRNQMCDLLIGVALITIFT